MSKLIVIEGIDAAGKTVQTNLLEKYFKDNKQRCTVLTFPDYNSWAGVKIRQYLKGELELTPVIRDAYYAIDRHLKKEMMQKLLSDGCNIICNRYSMSNFAYGMIDNDLEWLIKADDDMPQPNIVLLLDITPEIAMKRKQQHDRNERVEFLKKVKQNYLTLAERFKWNIIDATRSPEEIHMAVVELVNGVK